MPVMDGLTLLGRLPEASPITKTVMVSAYGDMQNIRAAMNGGAFDFVCKPVDFIDLEVTIEKTAHHVQQLRDTMRAIQENNILKMYVDETVINFMARPGFENKLLASETVEATVMFVDICGFTSLSESSVGRPPLCTLLNKYFDQIVQEVIAHGGYVDKFMGDAVMAVFRGEYHLDRAIDAALARAHQACKPCTILLPSGADYQPAVSIGINTGEMVSGNIGSATLKRLDYTVIGDTVNVSQRLQSSGPSPTRLSSPTAIYERIKESFQCRTHRRGEAQEHKSPPDYDVRGSGVGGGRGRLSLQAQRSGVKQSFLPVGLLPQRYSILDCRAPLRCTRNDGRF